jgi:FkbM family methyltransferase
MRFERLRRSRLFALIKGPLLHARNFLSSPVLSRIDGVQGTLGTHQRLIAQGLERAQATDTVVRQSAEVLEGLKGTLGAHQQLIAQGLERTQATDTIVRQSAEVLEGLQAQVTKLHQSVGLLQAKADDAAINLHQSVGLLQAKADDTAINLRQSVGLLHAKADDAAINLHQSVGLLQAKADDTAINLRQSVGLLQAKADDTAINLRQSVGLLHAKADDAAIKLRPLVHLKDAYAVPLRDGYLFVPEEEEGLLLMYTGAGPDGLEPGTRRILQMISPAGGTAVDVGASVGLHTLALAHAIGPAGKLHAFEAEPRLEPFLRRTLHANGLHQVELKILAIGAEHREAVFHVARTIGHSSLYALGSPSEVREEVKVQLRPLDELIPKTTKVNVIKIDVEGAELDVIKGAEKTLVRSADCALVAELGPSHLKRVGISLAEWLGAFERFGLKSFAIEEPYGEVKAADPGWLAEQHSVNMLFCRPGSFAHSALLEHKALKSL